MNTIATLFLAAAVASSPAAAQPPDYRFRVVIQPGMIIAGRTLTEQTVIGSVALNDTGDFAFVAMEPTQPPAILTSKRVVVRQDEVIDGRAILIATHGQLAVNSAGQVAYEGWWSTDPNDFESPGKSGAGIFVDSRLVVSVPWDVPVPEFTLTDDGKIITRNAKPAPASPRADIGNRIRIRPPKDSPVSLAPGRPQPRIPQKPSPGAPAALPAFAVNHRGDILFPVNFEGGSFGVLLGTSTTH